MFSNFLSTSGGGCAVAMLVMAAAGAVEAVGADVSGVGVGGEAAEEAWMRCASFSSAASVKRWTEANKKFVMRLEETRSFLVVNCAIFF